MVIDLILVFLNKYSFKYVFHFVLTWKTMNFVSDDVAEQTKQVWKSFTCNLNSKSLYNNNNDDDGDGDDDGQEFRDNLVPM